eukprot:g7673.t1
MGPKKILVSAKWKDQFTKLQMEVLKIPKLEKVIEEKDEEIEALKSFETQLNKFREEYDIMKKENDEATSKTRELQLRNIDLAKQVKKFRDEKKQVRVNTRRLEKQVKEEKKKNGKATSEIHSLFRKLGAVKSELEQEIKNRNHFAGELKKEKNNLERERESRLQDIHMKSLDRQRIDKLENAKEKLEKQLKMMDSITKGHTHESEILKKALDCSRNVSEMYEERLVLDDDEIADLKIRNAKLQKTIEKKEAEIAQGFDKHKILEQTLRAVQAYAMKLCKSSIDMENIMNPRTMRQNYMGNNGYLNEDGELEDPENRWADAMDGQELIVRRDMEPPLSQAPTYVSLIKHFEGLKISRRLQRIPDLDEDDQEISFTTNGPGTIPLPRSSEPRGFSTSQYRFMETTPIFEVSDSTLKNIQPPIRSIRRGHTLSDSTAHGRPARGHTQSNGLPPEIDTFYSPGGTGDVSLPTVASAPNLGGKTPDYYNAKKLRKQKAKSATKLSHGTHIKTTPLKKRSKQRRTDGKSVTSEEGSLYISTGIGIKREKVKRKLKGSAKHMLQNILDSMAK